jgi:hypothetical protein
MLERWVGKGSDRVIYDALFGTDILSSQYRGESSEEERRLRIIRHC